MPSFNPIAMYLGPGFIGFVICLCLYGTTLAQSVLYFRVFVDDTKRFKFLVALLCIIDTFHIYLLTDMFWYTLVQGQSYGLIVVLELRWQLLASFIIAYFVTFIVQGFFCARVWKVSHQNWVPTAIIATAAAFQLGAGLVYSAHIIQHRAPQNVFDAAAITSGEVELVSSIICDVWISVSLVYYFRANFSDGMKRMRTVLQKLIFLSINYGILLCVLTIATLILFKLNTFLALPPHFILSKLYVNSLIATLNSRKHLREISVKTATFEMPTIVTLRADSSDSRHPLDLLQND